MTINQADKLDQYNEFFTIEHNFTVNVEPLTAPVDKAYFEQSIPLPFKLASDNAQIDQSAFRSIQGLSSVANQLTTYLHHQANKIDLLVGYILSQQDDESKRFKGLAFGGGGFVYHANTALALGEQVIAKLFILEENCAVFCHAQVIEISELDGSYNHKLVYQHIREEDRENLVRTSLHIQSKQLQSLAKKRNQEANQQD